MSSDSADFVQEDPNAPLIVILATSTREKIEHYKAAARLNKYPIVFIGLREVKEAFVAAVEDTGSAAGNAYQKWGCVNEDFDLLKDERTPHHKALLAVLASYGLNYDPKKTALAVEDSSLYVPPLVWRVFKKLARPFVPAKLLQRAEKEAVDMPLVYGDGCVGIDLNAKTQKVVTGPAAETGGIFNALTYQNCINLFLRAKKMAGFKGALYLLDQVDFQYNLFSDVSQAPKRLITTRSVRMLSKGNFLEASRINLKENIFGSSGESVGDFGLIS